MYKIETVEDQQKFALPLNRDTEQIYYNQRFIIDSYVLSEPRAWVISKVNRMSPNGVAIFTLAQDRFNQQTDYIEVDENNNVIGMWADYYKSSTPMEQNTVTTLSHSGLYPQLRVGGSYKTVRVESGTAQEWIYTIDDDDATSLLSINNISDSEVKIKFIGDSSYIGKTLIVSNGTSSIEFEIIGL